MGRDAAILTDGPGSKRVVVELIDFIFFFYQSLVFLLQRTVFIQGLQRQQGERKTGGRYDTMMAGRGVRRWEAGQSG